MESDHLRSFRLSRHTPRYPKRCKLMMNPVSIRNTKFDSLVRWPNPMRDHPTTVIASRALAVVKVAQTLVWAVLAGCILALPIASWLGEHRIAGWLASIVVGEVAVLVFNRWRCPLTSV